MPQILSDAQILEGFRQGNAHILQTYFYGYCREGYYAFDRRYDLRHKQNLDCLSLTHQYAIHLIEHQWRPLEDRAPGVSLKTWIIGGFRYVILDALKWYQKEYGQITFDDYLQQFNLDSNLRRQFHATLSDLYATVALSQTDRTIVQMLLEEGMKGKEVAQQLGVTPAAVSQRYKQLKERIIAPYFRKYFDLDIAPQESVPFVFAVPEESAAYERRMFECETRQLNAPMPYRRADLAVASPAFITTLAPDEIFVFGSNLRGLHNGGGALMALQKFGAVMGQGKGPQGQSYAIPTMQGGVETIRPYVDEFLAYASRHSSNTFLLTRIGCGTAGFDDDDIAPLFAPAHYMKNIRLPQGW